MASLWAQWWPAGFLFYLICSISDLILGQQGFMMRTVSVPMPAHQMSVKGQPSPISEGLRYCMLISDHAGSNVPRNSGPPDKTSAWASLPHVMYNLMYSKAHVVCGSPESVRVSVNPAAPNHRRFISHLLACVLPNSATRTLLYMQFSPPICVDTLMLIY